MCLAFGNSNHPRVRIDSLVMTMPHISTSTGSVRNGCNETVLAVLNKHVTGKIDQHTFEIRHGDKQCSRPSQPDET